ncbi:MAG: CUB domain-containing protein, partial [Bacteroidota bacterium]
GWFASYQAYFPLWCSGTTDMTNVQDTIEDGSGLYNYTNNSSCQWLIHPANATQITLHFLEFDIEQNKDFVKVFNAQASTLIQTLTGSTLPANVSCNCNSMRVQFTSNTSNAYPGFKAYYTIITGMEELSGVDNLSLYPNPADKNFNFSFSLQNSELVSIKLSNILGEEMMSIPVQKNMEQYNQQVDVSNLSSGVYFLNITTTKGVNSVKLVLE